MSPKLQQVDNVLYKVTPLLVVYSCTLWVL